jgi:hypothetical protein
MNTSEAMNHLVKSAVLLIVSGAILGWMLYDYLPTTSAPQWMKALMVAVIPVADVSALATLWKTS